MPLYVFLGPFTSMGFLFFPWSTTHLGAESGVSPLVLWDTSCNARSAGTLGVGWHSGETAHTPSSCIMGLSSASATAGYAICTGAGVAIVLLFQHSSLCLCPREPASSTTTRAVKGKVMYLSTCNEASAALDRRKSVHLLHSLRPL